MAPGGPSERLAAACRQVEQVCTLLVSPSPEILDRCPLLLANAQAKILDSPHWLRSGDVDALAEANRLRRAVLRADTLLRNAWAYHRNWNRLLGSLSGGYVPGGRPATVAHQGKLLLQG